MMRTDLAAAAEIFRRHDNFLLVAHEKPDGDATGSIFGLYSFLTENGKKAVVLFPDEIPADYRKIAGGLPFVKEIAPEELSGFSHCVTLDVSNPLRVALGPKLTLAGLSIPQLNIDHHPDNKITADFSLVTPERAATCQILHDIAALMKDWTLSPRAAGLFLMGIFMDTGCFKYGAVSPGLFNAAAGLVGVTGSDRYKDIINTLFFEKPASYMRMEADLLLNHVRLFMDGRYALARLTDELLARHGVNIRDTEGLINVLRSIAGVEIAVILYRKGEKIKASFRSKSFRYPVAGIARTFPNGGGHELAAGAIIDTASYDEAEKILYPLIERALNGPAAESASHHSTAN